MHGDLSENLHTPECNLIIKQLKNCHTENPFGKFIGTCNQIDSLLVRCLKNERISNQKENFKKSVERQKQFKERLASNVENNSNSQ